jgi:serine/threonine protein kinase
MTIQDAALPSPRTDIPGFRLSTVIGRGSVGTVWRARAEDGRDAAVKIIPYTPFHERDFVVPIVRAEETVFRAVPQARIVPILGVGELDDAAWLAMAYFPDGTLERLIALPAAEFPRKLAATVSLAQSLAAVHEAGFFHGDLKPSNILLDAADVPHLIDFYFAASSIRTRRNDELVVFSPMGTPRYMSPEQTRNRPISAKCDLYSFGVLAYELLTGRLPYPTEPRNLQEMTTAVTAGKIVPPRHACPHIPAAVAEVLVRLLALAPEGRPHSMREAADALAGKRRIDATPSRPTASLPWWRRILAR